MKICSIVIASIFALVLMSCDSDIRSLKKFESRLNACEYSCASIYLYNGDLPNFSFFVNEVHNGNLMINLVNSEKIELDGTEAIVADFKLVNASNRILNYFNSIGYKVTNDTFRDTIRIRQTNDGNRLSFNWGLKSSDENHYKLAYIAGDSIETLNIRNAPTTKGKIIDKLQKGNDILINYKEEHGNWKHCYSVNKDGNVVDGYVSDKHLGIQNSSFFELGLFDSMTVTVAVIVLVVIVVFFVFGSSIIAMLSSIPVAGIIIVIGAILGLIYTVYQLLEKILFELFIINLPY